MKMRRKRKIYLDKSFIFMSTPPLYMDNLRISTLIFINNKQ